MGAGASEDDDMLGTQIFPNHPRAPATPTAAATATAMPPPALSSEPAVPPKVMVPPTSTRPGVQQFEDVFAAEQARVST